MTDPTTALAEALAELTEGLAPGPFHAVEDGDKAMYGWWLTNAAGDSSFPSPDDVALFVNALPGLLAEIARLRAIEAAAREAVHSIVAVPMERDDDDGPAEVWCVHPDPLAALRAALEAE
ncbi:MAG TPA: hypothetical protein VLM76_06400 [Patescibacteria group bacterium]|nr:hypothetical protein [Patescibacteria group bacterium]